MPRIFEIIPAFLKLGCIAFGGPVAHISYLREEFVGKRHWLDDAAYGDLVALCQFLPGPASSQLAFALGRQRAGWLGGWLASVCFMLPSAALMILFGYGVTALGHLQHAGWLHGLKLAAVAVVAQAVWNMGRNLCPDRTRMTIAIVAAALLLFVSNALIQIAVIFSGGVVGWWFYQNSVPQSASVNRGDAKQHLFAGAVLTVFGLLLVGLPVLTSGGGNQNLALFDRFYRAGSLVFGGGHVVLPLLRAEVVPPGWVSDDAFLAGYGAAQALPGPLFTFAAFLGTVIHPGPHAWLEGLWCLLAIFLPAWLLIAGTLPFWHQLRTQTWTQAALRGTNAAVVGVLLAALYNPVWTTGVANVRDAAIALTALGLFQWRKIPAWLLVLLCAAAGQWLPK